MDTNELRKYHETITREALSIMLTKNRDYAGSKLDTAFANFMRSEQMGICSTEQAFLVRMVDKISRLSTFANTGKLEVANEGVRDAVLDLINYLILFGAYIEHKNKQPPKTP